MLKVIDKQIKELQGTMPDAVLTDKEVPEFGKIEEINTVSQLIKLTSCVVYKEKAYNEAVKLILPKGITAPAFKLNGMSPKQIIDHVKVRVNVVYNKSKLDKLKAAKAKLEQHLSAEDKLAKDLAGLSALINEENLKVAGLNAQFTILSAEEANSQFPVS